LPPPDSSLTRLLAACRAWIVESENRPQRAQFLPDLQPNSPAIRQKYDEKCAAAVDLQPTTSKSDRLLDSRMVVVVWTPRGEARRIISMRNANEREIKKILD
jgi:hypothetical protein